MSNQSGNGHTGSNGSGTAASDRYDDMPWASSGGGDLPF